jgi:CheY-like chemotaxis protein
MPSLQRLVETDRNFIVLPSGPPSRTVIITTDSRAYDLFWPVVRILCAIFFGSMIAFNPDKVLPSFAAEQLHRLAAWCNPLAEPEANALVVTANLKYRLAVVATLSPRGFQPLLASNGREVLAQIQAHPEALRLAVVDAAMPDYAFIARCLRKSIPNSGIIVLQRSFRFQDIGPMLLDSIP